MRNADEIKASVMEIGDTDVTYYEWNDFSKTVRVLKKDEIFMIRYQNGTKDVFRNATERSSCLQYPYPRCGKRYSVGDYFNEDGVEGIVFYVNEDGHGLLRSLDARSFRYSMVYEYVGATDMEDGWNNLSAIENFITSNDMLWDAFEGFRYVHEMGKGWYIPAVGELVLLVEAYKSSDFLSALKEYGAKEKRINYAWGSSSEHPKLKYWDSTNYFVYSNIGYRIVTCSKSQYALVMPIHKF